MMDKPPELRPNAESEVTELAETPHKPLLPHTCRRNFRRQTGVICRGLNKVPKNLEVTLNGNVGGLKAALDSANAKAADKTNYGIDFVSVHTGCRSEFKDLDGRFRITTGFVAILDGKSNGASKFPAGGVVEGEPDTIFHAVKVSKVTFSYYVNRIQKNLPCSDACFVAALVYMDRAAVEISTLTGHRLVLTSIMLAMRFLDDAVDVHYNNAFFAKLGGIRSAELAALESRFLQLLDWRLMIGPFEFQKYYTRLWNATISGNTEF